MVVPLARAGIAAGADGVMVDVHPQPELALVDGAQALTGATLDELAQVVITLPALLGRTSAAHLAG
jgi:3-deoxy-7-phosphoheptulonate synthase